MKTEHQVITEFKSKFLTLTAENKLKMIQILKDREPYVALNLKKRASEMLKWAENNS